MGSWNTVFPLPILDFFQNGIRVKGCKMAGHVVIVASHFGRASSKFVQVGSSLAIP
jgi:hypothetical protein